jgi:hypothetical protein
MRDWGFGSPQSPEKRGAEKIMIELSEGTVNLLISIVRDSMFVHTGDRHSDKATHPIEANLLDHLIEKREAFRKCFYPGYLAGKSHVKPDTWTPDQLGDIKDDETSDTSDSFGTASHGSSDSTGDA